MVIPGPGSGGDSEQPGKAGAADTSEEGSFASSTATDKHLLAAESAPITVKALLIGSRANSAWAGTHKRCTSRSQASSSADVPVQAGTEGQVPCLQRWEDLKDRADKDGRHTSGKPFVPSSLLKGCRGGCRSADAAMLRKAASTPFAPPKMCSSICLSAVCLSFLPSDNLTLISPALLSWSHSFLSQFR